MVTMDMVTLILFVVLEVVLLLGFAIFVLWCKYKVMRHRLRAQAPPVPVDEDFASIESGYLPYLEKEIIATRSRLELSETESGDADLPDALRQRLIALEAEKKVAESCNDYPERQWEFVTEYFQPQVDESEEEEVAEEVDDALLQAQTRIQSLEKFRDNFFALKNEVDTLEDAKQRLADKLEQLLPEAERAGELQSLLEDLNGQQNKLKDRLEQLENQAENLEPPAAEPAESAAVHEAERIGELQGVLNQQGSTLTTMRQVLDQIKQDPQAELIEALEKELHDLEQRYREASTCIEIMQQENDRLQEKVDRKDYRLEQVEAERNESVADLQEQVGKQKRSVSELQEMVNGLQLEAEKAEQVQAKLDQFNLASRDMNMCIQVLEEENEFLQEQIKTLLQADESSSVYDKVDEENNSEALKQQIEDLKNQLQEKAEKIKEVEARYASMEKEYLTLYEETQTS